jgi:hypothetical protein
LCEFAELISLNFRHAARSELPALPQEQRHHPVMPISAALFAAQAQQQAPALGGS